VGFLQDLPPASTAHNTMPITIDNQDIANCLVEFNIKPDDYYLLFDNNVVYIVWCAKYADVPRLALTPECLDVEIKGSWIPYENVEHKELTPLFCARYILATN
jgi:hypothetical protein